MEKPWLHDSAPDGAVELKEKETHTPTPNPTLSPMAATSK